MQNHTVIFVVLFSFMTACSTTHDYETTIQATERIECSKLPSVLFEQCMASPNEEVLPNKSKLKQDTHNPDGGVTKD